MAELTFETEWVDPGATRGDELRATWARLVIRVGGRPVTRVSDMRSQSVRDCVYVPLYPLAEWIALNWWCLTHAVPRGQTAPCLVSAREGYALPPLTFSPMGELVTLRWEPAVLPAQQLEFLSAGNELLPSLALRESLGDFVALVVARLDACGVRDTLLRDEWQAISGLDEEEREFCFAATALGLDPFAIDEQARERLVRVAGDVPDAYRQEFLTAAEWTGLEEQTTALTQSICRVESTPVGLPEVSHWRRNVRAGSSPLPWEQGYELARSFRAALALGTEPLNSPEALAAGLGLETESFRRAQVDLPGSSAFQGLVAANQAGRIAMGLTGRREDSRRFLFCRGLSELLAGHNGCAALLTKTDSLPQRRSRAFAAEFLAPAKALRDRISSQRVSVEDAQELAAEFGVSWWVISHQLVDHRIGEVVG